MKKIMILMNVFMGLSMSFILSLVGSLMGGHFSIPSWLVSFVISLFISLIIGFLVPIKKIGDAACKKCSISARSLKGTLISAALSDLIYTPVITIIMVVVMLKMAAKHAPKESIPPIPTVLIPSLIVCIIVGFISIAIIQPLLMRLLMKNAPGSKQNS